MTERTNPLVKKNGVAVGRSYSIDFIEGAGVTLTVSATDYANTAVTIAAAAAGGGFAVDTGGNVA